MSNGYTLDAASLRALRRALWRDMSRISSTTRPNRRGGLAHSTRFVPITVSLNAHQLAAGDHIDLANFRVPTGQALHILAASIGSYDGGSNQDYKIEAYDVTDSESIYETSNPTLEVGTLHAPLASGAIGDWVVIRAENNTGNDNYLNALMTFAVM